MKLWDRFAFFEALKRTVFFLLAFYFFYVLFDYSSRTSSIQAVRFSWPLLTKYYAALFVQRLEVLLPFALLLAIQTCLYSVYRVNGWVALLTGGRPLFSLVRPYLLVASLGSLFLFFNEEWLVPTALKELNTIESLFFHKGEGVGDIHQRISVQLKDGSRLFFSSFDAKEKKLFDVWYLNDWNHLWHIEQLEVEGGVPVGWYVDKLVRNDKGVLLAEEEYTKRVFHKISFQWDDLIEMVSQPSNVSIREILRMLREKTHLGTREKVELKTYLIKKVTFPLLPVIITLFVLPLFFSVQRQTPFFYYSLLSLSLFITTFLFLSAMVIVGSSGVLSPFVALGVPWLFLLVASNVYFGRFLQHGAI